jgi:hypothetical protein
MNKGMIEKRAGNVLKRLSNDSGQETFRYSVSIAGCAPPGLQVSHICGIDSDVIATKTGA